MRLASRAARALHVTRHIVYTSHFGRLQITITIKALILLLFFRFGRITSRRTHNQGEGEARGEGKNGAPSIADSCKRVQASRRAIAISLANQAFARVQALRPGVQASRLCHKYPCARARAGDSGNATAPPIALCHEYLGICDTFGAPNVSLGSNRLAARGSRYALRLAARGSRLAGGPGFGHRPGRKTA